MAGPGTPDDPNAMMAQALMPQQEAPADTSLRNVGLPQSFGTYGVGVGAGGGGMAPGVMGESGVTGGGGLSPYSAPYAEPQNWGLTRQDLENPLAYTNNAPGGWEPRDTGGWFTLNQLYQFTPGGLSGGVGLSGPSLGGYLRARQTPGTPPPSMSAGADLPSTNNWRLLGDPGLVMRNGHLINTRSIGASNPNIGQSRSAWFPASFGTTNSNMQGEYPMSGMSVPQTGYPGYFHGEVYWPGQMENAMPIGKYSAV